MRGLKFRAWDTGAKRWTSGVMPVLTGLSLKLKPAHSGIIIDQYTGLKDEKVKKLLGEVVELELTVNELSKRFGEFNKHYVELCGGEG